MKILLFGDIAAGKTTISKKIIQQYSGFELIAIDDFRRKFGDFTMKGETLALSEFLKALKKNKNQIVEASGLGKLGEDIYYKISKFNEKNLVVVLHIPVKTINERIKNRIWDIPFPGKQEKLNTIIQSVNLGIKFGKIPLVWSELPKTVIFQIENNNLNTQNYITNTIINFIKLNSK